MSAFNIKKTPSPAQPVSAWRAESVRKTLPPPMYRTAQGQNYDNIFLEIEAVSKMPNFS